MCDPCVYNKDQVIPKVKGMPIKILDRATLKESPIAIFSF